MDETLRPRPRDVSWKTTMVDEGQSQTIRNGYMSYLNLMFRSPLFSPNEEEEQRDTRRTRILVEGRYKEVLSVVKEVLRGLKRS